MSDFSFRRRMRHPFCPALAADPAANARGRSKALAGTFAELSGAAARGVEAQYAVFVLTSEREPLGDGQRDDLWRLFQVPVYALRERAGVWRHGNAKRKTDCISRKAARRLPAPAGALGRSSRTPDRWRTRQIVAPLGLWAPERAV